MDLDKTFETMKEKKDYIALAEDKIQPDLNLSEEVKTYISASSIWGKNARTLQSAIYRLLAYKYISQDETIKYENAIEILDCN